MRKPKRFPTMTPGKPDAPVYDRVLPRQITTGVAGGQILLDTNKVQINASDGNIIISDGTTQRVLIGFQADGF